jgi:hypothetical protein
MLARCSSVKCLPWSGTSCARSGVASVQRFHASGTEGVASVASKAPAYGSETPQFCRVQDTSSARALFMCRAKNGARTTRLSDSTSIFASPLSAMVGPMTLLSIASCGARLFSAALYQFADGRLDAGTLVLLENESDRL